VCVFFSSFIQPMSHQFFVISFRFCFERGYLLSSSASGDYGRIENYSLRPHDEIWIEGMEPLPVPDW